MKKTSVIVIVALVVSGFLLINFLPNLGGEPGVYVIETSYGKIKVRLYDETPQHRDNFMRQVKEKAYNKTFVNAIFNKQIVLAGDIEAKEGADQERGGSIPSEINPKYFPKKGALVAYADERNPGNSVDDQFILVKGDVYTKEKLVEMEKEQLLGTVAKDPKNADLMAKYQQYYQEHKQDSLMAIDAQFRAQADQMYTAGLGKLFSKEQIEAYSTVGGFPQLDGKFTVFGEVIEGMDVLEKMLTAEADQQGKPMVEIPLTVKND
ncbi:MAG: peptidylprolyl isomerase [Flavobacteriales bacterium]